MRQGQNKLINNGYLFVFNTLFHQTYNLSFSSGNCNSESKTYFCISDKYSPQPLSKKASKCGFKFKRFSCVKDHWRNCGSKAQKCLRRGLFIAYIYIYIYINCSSNICSVKLSIKIDYLSLDFNFFITTTVTFDFHLRHTFSIFEHLKQQRLNSIYYMAYY